MIDLPSESIDLPSESIEMLTKLGKTEEEIKNLSNQIRRSCPSKGFDGDNGRSTFKPEKNIAKEIATEQIDYLSKEYKKNLGLSDDREHLAKLIASLSPAKRKRLIKNWKLFGKGRIGLKYVNGTFIANMDEFAYYSTDLRATLGIETFPEFRQPNGQDDPLKDTGINRPGCFALGNLSIAIEKFGELPEHLKEDITSAKTLVAKIYAHPPQNSLEELKKFQDILKKVPKYCKDGMVYHEHYDGRTLYMVPAGKFHPGPDPGKGGSIAPHTGGHKLLELAYQGI